MFYVSFTFKQLILSTTIKCNELPESNCLISEFSPTSSNSPLSHHSVAMMSTFQQNNCLICNTGYSSKQALMRHELSVHKNVKFSCQTCGKQFAQKSGLTLHINSVHKGIKHKLQ